MDRILKSSRYIAIIRTMAPLLWAGVITWFADRGLNLTTKLADLLNIPEAVIDDTAPLILAAVLWLIAVYAPSDLVEKILLGIKVDDMAYDRAGTITTRHNQFQNEDVVIMSPGHPLNLDGITSKIIASEPSGIDTTQAMRRLSEYLDR